MIRISDLQFFQLVKPKLGDNETEALVNYIDAKMEQNNEHLYKILATKEDIAKLDLKISDTKSDTLRWVFSMFFVLMMTIIGLYFKK